MKKTLVYGLSLGFTILLTFCSFITFVGWLGMFINNLGRSPVLELFPWQTLGLVALAALNCTLRARFIVRRGLTETSG